MPFPFSSKPNESWLRRNNDRTVKQFWKDQLVEMNRTSKTKIKLKREKCRGKNDLQVSKSAQNCMKARGEYSHRAYKSN